MLLLACGRSRNPFNPLEELALIAFGRISTNGDFPWMAAIYYNVDKEWNYICGGTLISPGLVLTGNIAFFYF